jgi:ABC-type uncharacterized transport system involved in gliding motility auxiliary subunit
MSAMFYRIANILGWAGVALVFAAVALRFIKPELIRVWQGLAIGGLVCILIYVLSQWREIVAALTRRQARYGTLALISVVTVLAILVGINYIASRQNKRWDLTSSQQFTLSDQTRKVVQGLKRPLKMMVFSREDDFQRFRDRVEEYGYLSKQVRPEYIDADRQPALVRQYQINQYGTIAVEYDGRIERVTSTDEQELTNAIIKAVEGQQKKVYFTAGHGEHDPTSADERIGYNTIASALGRDNFMVEKLSLAQKPDVPDDAAVVVVAGPTSDFLQPEIDALKRYLNKGGKAILMVDPPDRADAPPLANLIALAREWGIEVGNNLVIDRSGIGQLLRGGPGMPVATNYPSHAITERFNVLTAFPLARSVSPVTGNEASGRTAQPLVETSPQSWAEADVKALAERRAVDFNEGAGDKQGPISLAAAVSATAPNPPAPAEQAKPAAPGGTPPEPPRRETRVVVFGDSDFVSNDGVGVPGNADLFLNSVNWAAQQENMIAIRPKSPEDRRVTLTADQQTRIAWFSMLLLPGAIIAAGFYTWWRRRG